MTAPNYAYARQMPATQLERGDHVEFQGRFWLVEGVDRVDKLVSVALRESVFAPFQITTQFGLLTPVWVRVPAAQMAFTVASERERRDLVIDAAVRRIGAALVLEVAA